MTKKQDRLVGNSVAVAVIYSTSVDYLFNSHDSQVGNSVAVLVIDIYILLATKSTNVANVS